MIPIREKMEIKTSLGNIFSLISKRSLQVDILTKLDS